MTSVLDESGNSLRAYMEDISYLLTKASTAMLLTIGYLGRRTVIVLQDISKIVKTPESLRYTIRGIVSLINAAELFISMQISNKVVEIASTVLAAVAAWKVSRTILYFVRGNYEDDFKVSKICTIITEIFFSMGRIVLTGAWLVQEQLLSLAASAAIVGSIPVIGSALFAMGSTVVINTLFLIGFGFLIVDRTRAAINGGYVNQADEDLRAFQIRASIERSARSGISGPLSADQEIQVQRYIQEKKSIKHWVAYADIVNLVAESALLIIGWAPLALHLLGIIACSAGVTSCVWDKDPARSPQIEF